ncbi:tRNA-binding EMAP/Myf domain (EMAP) [Fructobacillus cardui]|uniref:YtpR family tRNA-binding protein n=1 Tax=Fructobacillus cardui TaxID=2893170 RepID=UPI002DA693B4|nr:tRNA-binding EMAP/Myf domain (EMAP) [Fructobacillus cardui]
MIAVYNQAAVGDILMLTFAPATGKVAQETKGQVTKVVDAESQQTLGINIEGAGASLALTDQAGQVFLTESQVAQVNQILQDAGFDDAIAVEQSNLVVGEVVSMTAHPDSDHLYVTQANVGNGESLQIVSGSPNMQEGIRVVVAKPGSMMPSGAIIWDGALRGVPSAGMIVSGRELKLPGAPDKPGALVLPADFGQIGQAFDFAAAQSLYADGLIDTNY